MSAVGITIITSVAATLLFGLFRGLETGMVAVDAGRIRQRVEEEAHPRAAQLLAFLERPNRLLTMIFLVSQVAFVGATLSMTYLAFSPVLADLPSGAAWLARVGMLSAVAVAAFLAAMIFESLFRPNADRVSLAFIPALRILDILLAPVTAPLALCTEALMRALGEEPDSFRPLFQSREDVRILVEESADSGSIEQAEKEMITSIIDLQTTRAKEIMIPRVEIQALPETATREDLIAKFEETGKTRIPIYRETIDNIIGAANAYDVLLDETPERTDIERFTKPVMHVPDSTKVDDLLERLKSSKQHMAVVTDEYGGTDGLLTLEDVLEEIFGEIHDEHDQEEHLLQRIGDNAYVVDGRLPLAELSEAIQLPMEGLEVETVGGWVMHVAGRIPMQGESFHHDGCEITVLAGGRNHISRIRLEIMTDTDAQNA